MRVLFFGTYDADAHPRVAVLRDGLREVFAGPDAALDAMPGAGPDARPDGAGSVTECNAPLGIGTAARVSMLRRPWSLPRLAWRLATCWATLVRRTRRTRREPRPDAVVVGYLGHFDVLLARRLFGSSTIVLDHLVGASDTATDRGVAGGLRHRLLRTLDDRALTAADIVVVDTEEHRNALPAAHRDRAVVVAVGAPHRWFAAAREPVADPDPHNHPDPRPDNAAQQTGPLRVVFFGLFTPLQGAPVIGAALARLAGDEVAVTMVGSGQDLGETRQLAGRHPGVTWLGWVPPDELPALVAAHDVCLGIFGTGPKARRVVPNKVFQGAAAGAAIVTSDTAPQRRMLGDAATYVPPGDPGALASVLAALAADRDRLREMRMRAHRLALDEFAAARVVAPLAERLRDAVGS